MSMRNQKKVCLSGVLFSALLLLASTVVPVHAADEMVFFHNDVMGSAIVAVNEYGDVCWEESYTPYGKKTLEEDVGVGMPPGCGLLGQERGYTSHTDDFESGLTYAQQRYYDPTIGRFLSIDPIGIDPTDPRTVNRYSYAFNSPYRYIDPDGMYGSDYTAENYAEYNTTRNDRDITDGYSDGWGNRVPGYSESDSFSRNVPYQNDAVAGYSPLYEWMMLFYNPFSKAKWINLGRKDVPNSAQRPSGFRKKTVGDSWDNAAPGSKPNTKKCPTCDNEVEGNPHLGEKRNGPNGWDNDHQPKWKDRDLTGMDRKQVLDEYNKDTRLRCQSCNRSDN